MGVERRRKSNEDCDGQESEKLAEIRRKTTTRAVINQSSRTIQISNGSGQTKPDCSLECETKEGRGAERREKEAIITTTSDVTAAAEVVTIEFNADKNIERNHGDCKRDSA